MNSLHFSIFVVAVGMATAYSPVVIWSHSELPSLDQLYLGYSMNRDQMSQVLIEPFCQSHTIVLVDVPDLQFKDLKSLAVPGDKTWKNMLASMDGSKVEKALNFEGFEVTPYQDTLCKNLHQDRIYLKEGSKNKASGFDDALGKITEKFVAEKAKVIYIIRGFDTVRRPEAENEADPLRQLKRRAATAAPADATASPAGDYQYFVGSCVQMYAKEILLQPVGPEWKSKAPYQLTDVAGMPEHCSSDEVVVTFSATATSTEKSDNSKNDLTDVSFQMTLYPYQGSQWFAKEGFLGYTVDGKDAQNTSVHVGYIASTMNHSYACQEPLTLPTGQDSPSANIRFHNLQLMVSFGGSVNGTFSEAVDCVTVFGPGAVMGTAVFLLFLFMFFYIALMFMTLSNPKFGDKTIVVTQE